MYKSLLIPLLLSFTLSTPLNAVTEEEVPLKMAATASREKITQGDPIFVKVKITNTGGDKITLDKPFVTSVGTLAIEVRQEGEEEFKKIRGPSYGAGATWFPPVKLNPGGAITNIHTVWSEKKNPIFNDSGRYDLRITAKYNGVSFGSRTVGLRVLEAPPGHLKVIRMSFSQLKAVVESELVPKNVSKRELDNLADKLGDSVLANTLEWMSLITNIRRTLDKNGARDYKQELARMRQKLNSIEETAMGVELARGFVEARKWASAKQILSTLDVSNYDVRTLQDVVKRHLQE